MNVKRKISLKCRIDRILSAYREQRFEGGQHFLTGDQLSQIYHINEVLRCGKVLCPRGCNTWSVHNMVASRYFEEAKMLALKLNV